MRSFILGFAVFFIFQASATSVQVYRQQTRLMGCGFEITVVAENQTEGDRYINAAIEEIERIERLISSWDPESQTSAINKDAGVRAVPVDGELLALIQRAGKVSRLTDGAFDITFASMDRIWRFDGSMKKMPTPDAVRSSRACVGYENVEVNPEMGTVFLKNEGMKIGFGGIGKGYAADKAKAVLWDMGVKAGIINASGDLCAWGKQPDGSSWKVAVVNPLNKSKVFAWMPVDDGAVVTSGSYENFVVFDGETYSHIIDPRTGYPSKGTLSVTIFSRFAELADALATAVFVMGIDAGLNLVNQLKGVECIIVDAEKNMHCSANIDLAEYTSEE